MAVAVVAEKPSVARDIARVLGARTRGEGVLTGNGYVVTWAIGHLVALAQPHEIRAEWKRWAREDLPLAPRAAGPSSSCPTRRTSSTWWPRSSRDPSVESVVCATDAGREGELIFRYLYEKAGCRKPVSRLWLSSLTPDAIREGFARLRAGAELDPLADAARGRSRADWLVGMNLSRAATLAHDETLHVGRVQTPTLALHRGAREGHPRVRARGLPRGRGHLRHREPGATRAPGSGRRRPRAEAKRLPPDGAEAGRIVARAKAGRAEVESANAETRRVPPPLLYDLTDLQRHANRLYGMSAKETLAAAQSLYEQKKLLSYPRTDSRHLSADVAATLPAVVQAISRRPTRAASPPAPGERPLSKRFVDDAKVTDHHAILPTAVPPEGLTLSTAGAADLRPRLPAAAHGLARRARLLGDHGDHAGARPRGRPRVDRYHSSGTAVEAVGWKVARARARARGPRKDARGEPGRATSATDDGAGAAAGPDRGPGGRGASTPRRWRSGRGRRGASPTPRCSPPWRRRGAPSTTASWPRP